MRVTRRLNAATPILVRGGCAVQHSAITTILKQAAPIAANAGLMFGMEALNTKLVHIGYFVDRAMKALNLIEEIDSSGGTWSSLQVTRTHGQRSIAQTVR